MLAVAVRSAVGTAPLRMPVGVAVGSRIGIGRDARRSGSTSVMVTAASPSGLRSRVPAKITSSMRAPRRLFADCSPSTQLMASLRFDLPQPFGPTTAAMPPPLKRQLGPIAKRLESLQFDAF